MTLVSLICPQHHVLILHKTVWWWNNGEFDNLKQGGKVNLNKKSFPGACSPFPFSRVSLMWSFQRLWRWVPWSSGETTCSCFFAPTSGSHTLKTRSSRKPGSSSKETFIVRHIRCLMCFTVDQVTMSYKHTCPLMKDHSLGSRVCVCPAGPI